MGYIAINRWLVGGKVGIMQGEKGNLEYIAINKVVGGGRGDEHKHFGFCIREKCYESSTPCLKLASVVSPSIQKCHVNQKNLPIYRVGEVLLILSQHSVVRLASTQFL